MCQIVTAMLLKRAYCQNSMHEMNKDPLVSVIMIFLDAEKFIREAIESVRSQKYPHWELILVDDGSTDSSTNIARSYARQHPDQIRYVEHDGHQNRGMSTSRNFGISKSRGDYIAFLDADDIYLPHKLETQVTLLAAQPKAAMIYGPTEYWHSWTGEFNDQPRDRMRTLGVRPGRLYSPPQLVTQFIENTARTPGTCSVLIRRDAIENVGGFEERFTGMFEDQAFFYKLCLHESVYVDGDCSARYRQHPDSHVHLSHQSGEWDPGRRLTSTRAAFLNWLENYLKAKEISDPLLWRPLRKEIWSYRHPKLYGLMFSVSRLTGRLGSILRNLL